MEKTGKSKLHAIRFNCQNVYFMTVTYFVVLGI